MNPELNTVLILEKLLIDKRKLYFKKITDELKKVSRRNRMKENRVRYHLKNRDKVKEQKRRYYLKNKEDITSKKRKKYYLKKKTRTQL